MPSLTWHEDCFSIRPSVCPSLRPNRDPVEPHIRPTTPRNREALPLRQRRAIELGTEGLAIRCSSVKRYQVFDSRQPILVSSVSEDRKKIVAIPFDLLVDLGDLRTGQS